MSCACRCMTQPATVLICGVVLASALWALACQPSVKRSAEPPASAKPEVRQNATELTLSIAAPRNRVPLSERVLAERPPILEIEITRIDNPARAPVSLAVALLDDGDDTLPIGRSSLYPSDRPATFTLRADDAWRRLGERDRAHLSIELFTTADEASDLSLEIEVRWRPEP